jgi:hypothetical protein
MEVLPRVVAAFTRAADATQYAQKDAVMPNPAAPMVFDVAGGVNFQGRVTGARMTIAAASGNLVTANLSLGLYLFRGVTDIPFAGNAYPADNAALTFTEAMLQQLVGVFRFDPTGWDPVDGGVGYQTVGLATRPYASFNLDALTQGSPAIARPKLNGLIRVEGSVGWNPGNVAQSFQCQLDVENAG